MDHRLTTWQRRLAPVLSPLSSGYAELMRLRRWAFENDFLNRHRPSVPTVSVGNIAVGGSGKTPLTSWLIAWTVRQGKTPAVLTRGYRGAPPHLPYFVTSESTAREAGDEPLMLSRRVPQAIIAVDPKRARSAPVVEERGPDVIFLDDGMQHLAVSRDVEIVMLRPEDLEDDWDLVLPRGVWREGRTALSRATAFCVKAETTWPGQGGRYGESPLPAPAAQKMLTRLGPYGKPVFCFTLQPTSLVNVKTGAVSAAFSGQASTKNTEPYILITGVGSPAQVVTSATRYFGRPPEAHLARPDHHPFTQADWDEAARLAKAHSAPQMLCTPKDAVKLETFADERLHAFVLDLRFHPTPLSPTTFPHWWERTFDGLIREANASQA